MDASCQEIEKYGRTCLEDMQNCEQFGKPSPSGGNLDLRTLSKSFIVKILMWHFGTKGQLGQSDPSVEIRARSLKSHTGEFP